MVSRTCKYVSGLLFNSTFLDRRSVQILRSGVYSNNMTFIKYTDNDKLNRKKIVEFDRFFSVDVKDMNDLYHVMRIAYSGPKKKFGPKTKKNLMSTPLELSQVPHKGQFYDYFKKEGLGSFTISKRGFEEAFIGLGDAQVNERDFFANLTKCIGVMRSNHEYDTESVVKLSLHCFIRMKERRLMDQLDNSEEKMAVMLFTCPNIDPLSLKSYGFPEDQEDISIVIIMNHRLNDLGDKSEDELLKIYDEIIRTVRKHTKNRCCFFIDANNVKGSEVHEVVSDRTLALLILFSQLFEREKKGSGSKCMLQ